MATKVGLWWSWKPKVNPKLSHLTMFVFCIAVLFKFSRCDVIGVIMTMKKNLRQLAMHVLHLMSTKPYAQCFEILKISTTLRSAQFSNRKWYWNSMMSKWCVQAWATWCFFLIWRSSKTEWDIVISDLDILWPLDFGLWPWPYKVFVSYLWSSTRQIHPQTNRQTNVHAKTHTCPLP